MPQQGITRVCAHAKQNRTACSDTKSRQTAARKAALVAALRESGNISFASAAAAIDRATHYRWLHADTVYAEQVADAMEEAGDKLEAEARRRAVDGWDEPVFQGGVQVGIVQRFSDTLLITLLRGAFPEKYGTGRLRVSGSSQHNYAVPKLSLSPKPSDDMTELLKLSGVDLLEALRKGLQSS